MTRPQKAIYPGTFDPITYGHINILSKAVTIFDEVILAVAKVTGKHTLFSTDERYDLCLKATEHIPGIRVEKFDGLVINFAEQMQAHTIIRGLRAVSDFEYELQLSLMNKNLDQNIETIFLVPDAMYLYLSSSMVRQIVSLGGNLKNYIPFCVEEAILQKYTANI
jgi:pantetheine-phosphate adenylyltransferase